MSREQAKAEELADRLEAYWRKRGYAVRAWAELATYRDHHGQQSVWTVRSNLLGGHPVRRIEA